MAFAMTAVSLLAVHPAARPQRAPAAGSSPSVQAESSESADASALLRKQLPKTFLPKTLQRDGAENNSGRRWSV